MALTPLEYKTIESLANTLQATHKNMINYRLNPHEPCIKKDEEVFILATKEWDLCTETLNIIQESVNYLKAIISSQNINQS